MTAHLRVAFPIASALALFATPLAAQPAATMPPPMQPADLITMPRLGSPTVDPEGRVAVYSVTSTDPESYARSGKLWLRSLADADAKPIALDLEGSSASFAGDGWLYYLADDANGGDNATSQVWRAKVSPTGQISGRQQVTDFPRAVNGFEVARDGAHIAVWADIARTCARIDCDDGAKRHLPGPGDARLYEGDEGFYRHWDAWETPGVLSRVFAV